MARNTENGISGTIGPVIHYNWNDKNFIRSKPAKRKKKYGQLENPLNTVFGDVSRYGTPMIKLAKPFFQFSFNQSAYSISRGWMRNIYAKHKDAADWPLLSNMITACQLNPAVDLRNFITKDIIISDEGSGIVNVTIPSIDPFNDLHAPPGTVSVTIRMVLLTNDFKKAVSY